MAQFKAYSPNVEVNGETVLSVVKGMGAFRGTALKILSENQIENPQPGKWYPQVFWLNAFKVISEKVGARTLRSIGLKIPETAKFPPQIDSIETALSVLNVAYNMNHRGGNIGKYEFRKTEEKAGNILCQNPYPCDFDEGIIHGTARKFQKDLEFVKVTHADGNCRKNGADSCTYKVSW